MINLRKTANELGSPNEPERKIMPTPVIHHGRVLLEHMLASNWTLTELAGKLSEPADTVRDFLMEFGDITPDLAKKIATLMGTSEIY